MRVLLCHNYYAARAGECRSVDGQARLLREAGHEVTVFSYDNTAIVSRSGLQRAGDSLRAVYSLRTVDDIERVLRVGRFDVAYVHNTWPIMSPSVFSCLSRHDIAVVAALYNFRWLCPAATLYRAGRVCHDCADLPGGVLHAVAHRCYRDSYAASLTAAISLLVNRDLLRVLHRHVDAIAVQTDFVRALLASHGFPANRLAVVGYAFIGGTAKASSPGDHMVFAGRLEEYKGVRTLLAAAALARFPLHILGDGPLAGLVADTIAERPGGGGVTYRGRVDAETVLAEIAGSAAVIVPSEWYESYPNVICEAMAHGRPVIASRIGGIPDIVKDGVNGLLFEPGDPASLAERVTRFLGDPVLRARLEAGARASYAGEMSPQRLTERVVGVFNAALAHRRSRAPGAT